VFLTSPTRLRGQDQISYDVIRESQKVLPL
jgi:hypothetical protein